MINLLELLTAESIGAKYNRVPRHRAQKLENVMIALRFIEAKKIRLVGIGPEVFVVDFSFVSFAELDHKRTLLIKNLPWFSAWCGR